MQSAITHRNPQSAIRTAIHNPQCNRQSAVDNRQCNPHSPISNSISDRPISNRNPQFLSALDIIALMPVALLRRAFLKQTALLVGAGAGLRAAAQTATLRDVPRFDGELRHDEDALRAAANDWGGSVHRRPLAVLRPASATDVSRLVA